MKPQNILMRIIILAVAFTVCLSTLTVVASTDYKGNIDSALGYFKTVFKANFELPDNDSGKIPTDVWYLYPLYFENKLNDSDYAFMKPDVDLSADYTSYCSGDIAKQIMALAIYDEDFKDKQVNSIALVLANKQSEDGSFANSSGYASVTDTAWSIIALEIAKANGSTAKYSIDKAIGYLKSAQLDDSGYNDWDEVGSVDSTGMVMIALAIANTAQAKAISSKCVSFLHSTLSDGANLVGKGTYDCANSCSQSYGIIGLLAAGEDVYSEKWSVNDTTVVGALLAFQSDAGGFWYDSDSKNGIGNYKAPDCYSTYNAMLALCDLQYGNLWVSLANANQIESTTKTESIYQSQPDTLNPGTGNQPLNPTVLILFVVAAALIIVTIFLKYKK